MKLSKPASATVVAFILIAFSNACALCNNTESFMLQAASNDTRFNGLAIQGFHTMPLPLTDLTLGPNVLSKPVLFTFNGTRLASTIYGTDPATNCPLVGIQLLSPSFYYSSWLPASLYTAAVEGFTYDAVDGLANHLYGVKAWMACFWSHQGQPQLFNVGAPVGGGSLYVPSNCGLVKLMKAVE